MYGSHPYGTVSKRDIPRRHKASRGGWRTTDSVEHPVTVRRVAPSPAV